jgi:hypothetical protein
LSGKGTFKDTSPSFWDSDKAAVCPSYPLSETTDPARLQGGYPVKTGFQGGYPVNARYTGTLDQVMMAQRDANVVADVYIDASINIQLLLHTMQH